MKFDHANKAENFFLCHWYFAHLFISVNELRLFGNGTQQVISTHIQKDDVTSDDFYAGHMLSLLVDQKL
jgi:hypothetical protein